MTAKLSKHGTAKLKRAAAAKNSERFIIESYGVRIEFEIGERISSEKIKKRLKLILPNGFAEIRESQAAFRFSLLKDADETISVFQNGAEFAAGLSEDSMLDQLEGKIRLTVAEFAVGVVFLHAGVVGWNGKAIVIPAKSFHGKTTLVAELVKKGAVYYSDEYAVLDEKGFVHPFPKMLSMRGIIDDFQQVELPVEKFNGVAGTEAIPVGMILFTEFQANARWLPKSISPGMGVMEVLAHTVPIINKPEFTLKVLNKVMNRAIITKTKRGDAARTAELLIGFYEKQALQS